MSDNPAEKTTRPGFDRLSLLTGAAAGAAAAGTVAFATAKLKEAGTAYITPPIWRGARLPGRRRGRDRPCKNGCQGVCQRDGRDRGGDGRLP